MALIVIGITGGVGAGKSLVLSLLQEDFHARVIKADEVGHRLLEPGQANYNWMLGELGDGILNPDGTINGAEAARRIFSDPRLQKKVNAATHPVIREAIADMLREYGRQQEEGGEECTAVIEAALLKEGGLSALCDAVWYVFAPKPVRIRRLMQSRGYSRKRCLDVMALQKSYHEFRAEADAVIRNDGSVEETRQQIRQEMEQLLRLHGPYASSFDPVVL